MRHTNERRDGCCALLPYMRFAHTGPLVSAEVSSTVEAIQMELMTNGPIEAGFMVHADFPHYRSGVYSHVEGEQVGGHAIKLLGWGTEVSTRNYVPLICWAWSHALILFFLMLLLLVLSAFAERARLLVVRQLVEYELGRPGLFQDCTRSQRRND
jgi:hypothetical protein